MSIIVRKFRIYDILRNLHQANIFFFLLFNLVPSLFIVIFVISTTHERENSESKREKLPSNFIVIYIVSFNCEKMLGKMKINCDERLFSPEEWRM